MAPRKIEVSFDPYFFHIQGKIYFKIILYKCEVNQMACMKIQIRNLNLNQIPRLYVKKIEHILIMNRWKVS